MPEMTLTPRHCSAFAADRLFFQQSAPASEIEHLYMLPSLCEEAGSAAGCSWLSSGSENTERPPSENLGRTSAVDNRKASGLGLPVRDLSAVLRTSGGLKRDTVRTALVIGQSIPGRDGTCHMGAMANAWQSGRAIARHMQRHATPWNATSSHVTPSHASETQTEPSGNPRVTQRVPVGLLATVFPTREERKKQP